MKITKQLKFCAAHRLKDHEGQCSYLHGHNYLVDVTVSGPTIDHVGRLIDFSKIKEDIGTWINAKWDHAFIYNAQDIVAHDIVKILHKHNLDARTYQLPYNPTAEHMAKYLFQVIIPGLIADWELLSVTEVRIWETSDSCACFGDGDGL